MTLPVDNTEEDEINRRAIEERPGDQVYATIRHLLEKVEQESSAMKERILNLVISDMALDIAITEAVDDIGKLIHYQAESNGIVVPHFSGDQLIKDAERIGRLRFNTNLARLFLEDDTLVDKIEDAEIARLWRDPHHPAAAPDKQERTLKLPDEVVNILRDISRTVAKASNGRNNATAKQPDPRGTVENERNSRGTAAKNRGREGKNGG